MLPYSVSKKVVLSGSFIEVYEYDKPYWVGFPQFKSFRSRLKRKKTEAEQEMIREDNVKRTRQKIRRLVNSNSDLNKFFTLTFDENKFQNKKDITDFNIVNRLFNQFIKRLTRRFPDLKYIAIPEYQSDYYYRSGIKKEFGGAVHYHLLINLPYVPVDDLENIWSNGFVKINKIDNIDNVGAYVCKYLGKANFDKRFFHKKKFFRSSNLLLPLVVDKLKEIINFFSFFSLNSLQKKFEVSYCSKWLGMVKYSQYRTYT